MKIENFNLIERRGKSFSDFEYVAEVDVTTGLLFKKTEKRKIYKKHGSYWCFVDTGEYTPDLLAEAAQRVFESENGCISS